MATLFLNSSPHSANSHGYRLAREMLGALHRDADPATLIVRDLAAEPLPQISGDYARAITSRDGDTSQFAWSEKLIAELEQTDLLVINTPMHNFTVPATLKLWIDHVLRIHRTFAATPEGKVGLLKDRPTIVIVGSGGFHAGESAKQPDFLTPYLRYALGSVGIHNVSFVLLQGLVMGDDMVARMVDNARASIAALAPFNTAVEPA